MRPVVQPKSSHSPEDPRSCRESLTVIDGVYRDPHEVRGEALEADYHRPHPAYPWYVALRDSRFTPRLVRRLEEIFRERIYDYSVATPYTTVGRFTLSMGGASPLISVHSDPFMWAAVIYLNPAPPAGSGTCFYRDRRSGRRRRRHRADFGDLRSNRPLNVCWPPDLQRYEIYRTVPNVYNRLVLYDARLFHSAEGFFGRTRRSARLTQALFFNLGRAYRA